MQLIVPRSWKEEFAAVAARREDILHREKLARHEDRERERRKEDKHENERQDADALAAIETVLATPEAVTELRFQIDDYDAKTVEALMERRELLDAVAEKIDTALEQAHELPDGRKVFKTKDGLRVVDENGHDLADEMIDPSEIDDKKTRWETFKALKEEKIALENEQRELLAYQAKLDEARERLDEGDITKKELAKIEADLAADMPEAVRQRVGIEQPKADTAPALDMAATKPAQPDELAELLRQTGRGAAPVGPS